MELAPGISYEMGYIVLHLACKPLTPQIRLGKEEWFAKKELHCSLVRSHKFIKRIAEVTGKTKDEAEQAILDVARKFFQEHPVTQADVTLTDDFRVARKDTRRSIIRMVELPAIAELTATLSEQLGARLLLMPAHISLYTGVEGTQGIGLPSDKALSDFTTPLNADRVAILKQHTNVDEVLA